MMNVGLIVDCVCNVANNKLYWSTFSIGSYNFICSEISFFDPFENEPGNPRLRL